MQRCRDCHYLCKELGDWYCVMMDRYVPKRDTRRSNDCIDFAVETNVRRRMLFDGIPVRQVQEDELP